MSGILYAAVAKSDAILVSSEQAFGNFECETKSFLPQVPVDQNTKTCFQSSMYYYHILVDNQIIYVCVTEPSFGRTVPYAFLNDVKEKFRVGSLVIRCWNASEHEFDREFGPVLEDLRERFSSQQATGTLGKVRGDVDDVINIMNDNIHKVVERGEKMDDLLDKTNELELTSMQFHSTAKKVHRKFRCKNIKMWAVIVFIVCIVITIIALMATNVIPVKG